MVASAFYDTPFLSRADPTVSEARRKRREERRTSKSPREKQRQSRPQGTAGIPGVIDSSTLRLSLWAAAAIAALTILVYWPVHSHPFIGFDDDGYVTGNPRVKDGLTLKSIRWALTTNYFANWHPLTWLSHMTDVQLFGLNAGAHHMVNVAFHAANSLLLLFVLWKMTGALWRSALVAGLFAVHPLHVESVAWVAERKDVLSTFFWLLAMWAYYEYAKRPPPRVGRYVLVLVLFGLGLAAKPMVVTFPCVLLLLDVWPLRRAEIGKSPPAVWLRLVYEKVPFFALAVVSSILTFRAQRAAGAVESLTRLPLSVRWENAIVSYWNYVAKLAWPGGMGLLYPYPKTLAVTTVLAALAALIAISAFVVWEARARPYLLVGWLWFLGTLVPVIGIIQVGKQPMADRYSYVPSIGLFVAVVWGGWELLGRLQMGKGLGWAVSTAAIGLYAILARQQVDQWKSGVALWTHTIEVTRDNYLAQNNLGYELARENRNGDAIPHYLAALREEPKFAAAQSNLALALVAVGRYQEAIAQFEDALRASPENYFFHGNLAFAFTHVGRLDDAISQFREAIRLKTDYVEALNGLGMTLARKGDVDGAIRQYDAALGYYSKFPEAHNNLGAALASQGRLDDAVAHFAQAIRLKPDYPDAHNNYGVALSSQGKLDDAVAQFLEAIRFDPRHARAHYGLGLVLQRQGKNNEAAQQFSEVLRLTPGDTDAQRALDSLRQHGQS